MAEGSRKDQPMQARNDGLTAAAATHEDESVADVEFGALRQADSATQAGAPKRTLDVLANIPLAITVQLGETHLLLRDLLLLGPGAVVELDRHAGEPIDLLVNGVPVGRGDVVVVNERFGLRITEIISAEDRLKSL